MAHYAKLDENNIVIGCIVIADKDCLDENGAECEENGRKMCEALTGHANWKKTSYNTRGGVHYNPNTDEPSADQSKAFRLNFAREKMIYDENLDGFIEPASFKITPLHYLNPETGRYKIDLPSIPYPEDLQLDQYPTEVYFKVWFWNSLTNQWIKRKRDESIPNHIIYPEILGYDFNFVRGITSE